MMGEHYKLKEVTTTEKSLPIFRLMGEHYKLKEVTTLGQEWRKHNMMGEHYKLKEVTTGYKLYQLSKPDGRTL